MKKFRVFNSQNGFPQGEDIEAESLEKAQELVLQTYGLEVDEVQE